jgi:hypothetical protein
MSDERDHTRPNKPRGQFGTVERQEDAALTVVGKAERTGGPAGSG